MCRFNVMAVVVAALLFSFSVASAEDKIIGAFGLKLGDTFDTKTAVGKSELTDGTPMFQFTTKKPFRAFKKYYVMITPKTKKIYAIWGIGTTESTGSGKKEKAVIMSILQKKYGNKEKEGLMSGLYDSSNIDQGNRYVLVKVSGFSDVTIDIRYYDKEMKELAERERIDIEAEKADSSGL